MGKRYFSDKIVEWYLENLRPLPWRETTDPYRIWLSEVILQQTRVAQGLPYYHRFIEKYPTVDLLAAASEQDILRLWQGLGYYTRARNLHKCAKAVVERHNSQFPRTSRELHQLPGIGAYTAAAIASFSFGEKVAVVDGNVFRILARIFGIDVPIDTPEGRRRFAQLANELISDRQPALHNQAVMEFGATLCTPRAPQCTKCPFSKTCFAFKNKLIADLPVKSASKKSRIRYFYYIVIELDRAFLMKKRDERDIWHGLFDFALVESDTCIAPEEALRKSAFIKWIDRRKGLNVSQTFVHQLSHQTIHCCFIRVLAKSGKIRYENPYTFYSRKQIDELPKPVLISRFLSAHEAK